CGNLDHLRAARAGDVRGLGKPGLLKSANDLHVGARHSAAVAGLPQPEGFRRSRPARVVSLIGLQGASSTIRFGNWWVLSRRVRVRGQSMKRLLILGVALAALAADTDFNFTTSANAAEMERARPARRAAPAARPAAQAPAANWTGGQAGGNGGGA